MQAEPTLDDGKLMFAFAHDLRAYLRTTLTRIQIVQSGGGVTLPEEERKLLGEAASAAGQMDRLLSAMVSYCDASRVPETENTIPVQLLVKGVIGEMKAPLEEAKADLKVDHRCEGKVPGTLRAAVRELIANACRFRDKNRQLKIEIAVTLTDASEIEIAVADNGIGVGQEWTERMFEPFQRLHSRNEFAGFGLGLATSRRIVRAVGGSISAHARDSGGLSVAIRVARL